MPDTLNDLIDSDIDLLDKEDIDLRLNNDGSRAFESNQPDEPSGDQPATVEGEDAPTGDPQPDAAKDGPGDPLLRNAELEFEIDSLKGQIAQMGEVSNLIGMLKDAKDPNDALRIIAGHIGADVSSLGQSLNTNGAQAPNADWAKDYNDETQEFAKSVTGFVESAIQAAAAPFLARIQQLESKLGNFEPQFNKAREQEQASARESTAIRRAKGVEAIVIQMSPGRNHGWVPSSEQIEAAVKADPGIFDDCKSAGDCAKKVVESLRIRHLDDVIAHSKTPKKPTAEPSVVPSKSDSRGSTSEYEARKRNLARRLEDGS